MTETGLSCYKLMMMMLMMVDVDWRRVERSMKARIYTLLLGEMGDDVESSEMV